MLGTNDCKAVYSDSSDNVKQNYNVLISRIIYQGEIKKTAKIVIVSPPPFGPDAMLLDKYKGGALPAERFAKDFK